MTSRLAFDLYSLEPDLVPDRIWVGPGFGPGNGPDLDPNLNPDLDPDLKVMFISHLLPKTSSFSSSIIVSAQRQCCYRYITLASHSSFIIYYRCLGLAPPVCEQQGRPSHRE